MSWIVIAISAYLLLAISNLVDKFLVDNVITSSRAYTFVVCLMGGSVILFSPWFLHWPGIYLFTLNIFVGMIFAIALWLLYESLQQGEASRVLVVIGGMVPIFTVFLSLFSGEHFTLNQLIGIAILSLGVFVIAFLPRKHSFCSRTLDKLKIKQIERNNGIIFAILSALAYALFFWLSKYSYNTQEFASAFIWNRMGTVLFVLLFLIRKKDRKKITKLLKRPPQKKHQALVAFNQILGAGGFILQNFAISLGPVALVNALQGIQYAFLLIIGGILAVVSPQFIKESFSLKIVIQKAVAIILIGIGIYFIIV